MKPDHDINADLVLILKLWSAINQRQRVLNLSILSTICYCFSVTQIRIRHHIYMGNLSLREALYTIAFCFLVHCRNVHQSCQKKKTLNLEI